MELSKIASSVIGSDVLIETSMGFKPLVYADYTASGRSLTFIEDFISNHVMPSYANTHTEFSFTGAQTTKYREQAREIIHKAVNGSASDKVIFCGSGATAAIDKLIAILGIRLPTKLADEYPLEYLIPETARPVVFVGPYEHHSNELPWRESIADVIAIPEDNNGHIDMVILKKELEKYHHRTLKIGSFSAASNVTGIRTDIAKVSKLLKQYDALTFWDYAAAAPYIEIDMNAETPLDVVFYSPHKFVGGPGTAGILIIKDHLLTNRVPAMVGGGTVSFVTPEKHEYIKDHVVREEAGTPAILESIRAGLVVKLQQQVGIKKIEAIERDKVKQTIEFLKTIDNVELLGNSEVDRISIFSLRFKQGNRDLHHGFVTALFNDVFGIQMRGGCSCAGPYGHYLLGIDLQHSEQLSAIVKDGYGCFKPGWVRFNLNYFISDDELNYILQAIKLVAELGYLMLPYYQLDQATGIWRYQGETPNYAKHLDDLSFTNTEPKLAKNTQPLSHYLSEASELLQQKHNKAQKYECHFPANVESLRWFATS